MKGCLFVGGTPLGNLGDISERLGDVLASVDYVLCEDTRVTRKLCQMFHSKAQLESLHQFNEYRDVRKWGDVLLQGKKILLVTDAGTPCISDPGYHLVAFALNHENICVTPLPGPCAVSTALSVCGFDARKFVFAGFLPRKDSEIQSVITRYAALEVPIVFYESANRILKTFEIFQHFMTHDVEIVMCKELTKQYEMIKKCSLKVATEWLRHHPENVKGEWTCVIGPFELKTTPTDIPDVQKIAAFFNISAWEAEKIFKRLSKKAGSSDA